MNKKLPLISLILKTLELRYGEISPLSCEFLWRNPVVSIGIHTFGFLQLVQVFHVFAIWKLLGLCDFCVSCAYSIEKKCNWTFIAHSILLMYLQLYCDKLTVSQYFPYSTTENAVHVCPTATDSHMFSIRISEMMFSSFRQTDMG